MSLRSILTLSGLPKPKEIPIEEQPLLFVEGNKFYYVATYRHPYRNGIKSVSCYDGGKELWVGFQRETRDWETAWKEAQGLEIPLCSSSIHQDNHERYGADSPDPFPYTYQLDRITTGSKPPAFWSDKDWDNVLADVNSWMSDHHSLETRDIFESQQQFDWSLAQTPLRALYAYHGPGLLSYSMHSPLRHAVQKIMMGR